MREPALPGAEIVDLATDLTPGGYYEAVGRSIFISMGGLTDLPMEITGNEAMDFTYSDRYENIPPSAVDPDTITLKPVEWRTESSDGGLRSSSR